MKSILACIAVGAAVAACGWNVQTTPGSSTAAASSETPGIAAPDQPATAVASPATGTPASFMPFGVTTWVANALLRGGPGYLFPQLAILREGASLTVLGQSPGGEWLLVQTTDNRSGWVFAQLVDAGGSDLANVPHIQPPSVQVVVGKVTDLAGQPISGIQFSLVQGTGNGAPRSDAVTDGSGTFYAFMPLDAHGTWDVGFTAVSCKSNTMDSNCNCVNGVCGGPQPERVSLELPQQPPADLSFTWK
jgi:hypothetical protein